jgi:DNA polymerase-1
MSRPNKVSHRLQDVVRRELGLELDKEHQKARWGGHLTDGMLAYAATDTRVLLPLAEALQEKASDAGLPFDAEGWREHLDELEKEKQRLAEQLDRLVPARPGGKSWNWNSPPQAKEAFASAGVPLPNTQEKTLSRLEHPLARVFLEYKRVANVVSNYGPKLLGFVGEDSRIRADWHQIGAGTGRTSCSKPALQQLTPEVKGFVRAPEGRVLVKADYSHIELRIAAKISGDERMLATYQKGEDIHSLTARSLAAVGVGKEDRKLAKAVNFGLLYGQGARGLREYARDSYGTDITLEEAALYKRRFFETYPGLEAWHDRERRALERGGTETRTLAGRRRKDVTRFTEWVNAPVQGTGADGLKLAQALLWERRKECPRAVPVATVHDEILVECDEHYAEEVEAWLKKAMVDGMDEVLNGAGEPHVPVEVETRVAKSWAG